MGFQIPRFREIIPPGSDENGKKIAAHWIVSQNGRIVPGDTIVTIGGYRFNGEPEWFSWFVYENHHTEAYSGDPTDPDGIGWPLGVSPMQIDLSSLYLKVYTKGGGDQHVVDGLLQPTNVVRHEFPEDPTKRFMIKKGDEVRTISRVTHHWDPNIGRVEVWIGLKGQVMTKYVDAKVPTMYTNEKLMSMYNGCYTDLRIGGGNENKTIDFDYILPRMAKTFADARVLVPTVVAEWGALTVDKTQGLVNGHLPPYATVDSEDWVWPDELTGSTTPPVVVPPVDTPYTVTQSVKTNTDPNFKFSGVFRWIANTSDEANTVKVEFYDNGTLLHTESTAPYGNGNTDAGSDEGSFDSNKMVDGPHLLNVRAYHKNGTIAQATAFITVQNGPVVIPPANQDLIDQQLVAWAESQKLAENQINILKAL